jgi:hypothetical protein
MKLNSSQTKPFLMKLNQRILATMLLIGLLAACSKSSDPAASTNCSITFKGTKYEITDIAVCTVIGTAEGIGGGTGSTGVTINITRDTADPDSNTVLFSTGTGSSNTYLSSDLVSTIPTITVSGKTWTYSGHATNSMGDEGDFTGTCTCKN